MSDLNVVCVEVGNYCGRGKEYVGKLFAGVKRHLPRPFRFVCVTDEPDGLPAEVQLVRADGRLRGWWQKVALFRPGLLPPGKVLYLDLDNVIVGDISPLADYYGPFAMVHDFLADEGSSAIMAWPDGFGAEIWSAYEREGIPEKGGDQEWIARHSPDWVSLQSVVDGLYAYQDCKVGLPGDARVVCFWGRVKPHDQRASRRFRSTWPQEMWV